MPRKPLRQAPDPADVALRLHAASIHLLRRLRTEDPAMGLTAAQASAMAVLVFGGPRTAGELAAAEQVTPPVITKLVQRLAEDGLVEQVVGEDDRRVRRIAATAKGRRILEEGRARRVRRLTEEFAALSEGDLRVLHRAAALLEDISVPAAGRARGGDGIPPPRGGR